MSPISLTPAELISQADELASLTTEYDALFSDSFRLLSRVNSHWSPNLANNFAFKLSLAQTCFGNLVELLDTGASAAKQCASGFDTIDHQLAIMLQGSDTAPASASASAASAVVTATSNLSDMMDTIDEWLDSLPKSLRSFTEDLLEDLDISEIQDAYVIINDIRHGDLWQAALDTADALREDIVSWNGLEGVLNWSSLKAKAVIDVLDLCTDPNRYILQNDERFKTMEQDDLINLNLTSLSFDLCSHFIETVGKGSVDVVCRLASDTIDSVLLTTVGVSFSTLNAYLDDTVGISPGSAFNFITGSISDGVSSLLDYGHEAAAAYDAFSKNLFSSTWNAITHSAN